MPSSPFWIVADEQTAGRGRQGRCWASARGNLYTALCFDATILGDAAALLPLALGIALADSVMDACPGSSPKLKWPNDVLIDGAKLSGLLVERRQKGRQATIVVGLGINVAHHPALEERATTSLRAHGFSGDAMAAFALLKPHVEKRVFDAPLDVVLIRERWLDLAAGLGAPITARLPDRTISGIHGGLDEDGALRLVTEEGVIVINAGDVFL